MAPCATQIKFNPSLTPSDPQFKPVLIIGQQKHLNKVKFSHIRCKLDSRVSEEVFNNAIHCLHPAPTDTCSLYLDLATVAALPLHSSRHNSNSRCHAITKLVKSKTLNISENIVIVCERNDIFASGCAVVRAFPLYSRKTGSKSLPTSGNSANSAQNDVPNTVNIEFLVVDSEGEVSAEELSNDDILCLEEAARGIRLAAKIVDAPCNEMNVGHFLDEIQKICKEINLKVTIIRGEELNERGFGGIYGVGKAANCPPALAVVSHEPTGATETVAWVGKGIVYDTGGLSIKGKTAMPGMKRDCGGAAAILGAFYAAVKCGFKQNLHAIFCLAENAVGPDATR